MTTIEISTTNELIEISTDKTVIEIIENQNTHGALLGLDLDNHPRLTNLLSTTLLYGGDITIDAGSLTVTIGAGIGLWVDNTTDTINPVRKVVTWDAFENISPDFLLTSTETYFYIDQDGELQQFDTTLDFDRLQDYIAIGWVNHFDNTIVYNSIMEPYPIIDIGLQFQQFLEYHGAFNCEGNIYGATNNNDLKITRSAGKVFDGGSGWNTNKKAPNICVTNDINPVNFSYYFYDSNGDWVENDAIRTDIDPNHYNTPTGKQAVPTGKWTIQQVHLYAPTEVNDIIYGEVVYDNKDEAIASLNNPVALPSAVDFDVLRGWLVVQEGCTVLSDTDCAVFVSARNSGGANTGIQVGVNVQVGTTTTLPAGSSATVINSGTPSDPILDFGIPKGHDIVWLGTFATAPVSPNEYEAYYNSTDKKSYIYYSSAWHQMAQDGTNGTNGTEGIASFNISALHLDIPLSADWPNQNVAETVPDPVNNALFVAQYDDTTAQLRGTMPLRISQDATNMLIRMYHRSQTAPSGTKTMAIKMYYRKIMDGVAVPSWSNTTLTGISIPNASNYFNVQDVTIALSTLSLSAGDLVQFAFERDVANDSLIGNWLLLALNVRFS